MPHYTTPTAQVFASDTGYVANIIDDIFAIDALATSSQQGAEEAIPVETVSAPQVLQPEYGI